MFKSWGYPARAEYARDLQTLRKQRQSGPSGDPLLQPQVGAYFARFKLHLATEDMGASCAWGLPEGMTVDVLITDYLRELGALVVGTLRNNYGAHVTKHAIQWCVTVPSIWSNAAKATMKRCMAAAGLVGGVDGSPHPLIMVLEPEAASFYCRKLMSSEQDLGVGEKLLVADIGGGTSDIVVQEVVWVGESVSEYRVREVTASSGGLCGGTYVDAKFMEFLHRRVGPCLQECIDQQLNIYTQLLQAWEHTKAHFGDKASKGECTVRNLPSKVAVKWEEYDRRMGVPAMDSYDELEISYEEMQSIFDPVVDQNMELIGQQLEQAGAGAVKAVVVVGGFAASPYLMECIRKRFAGVVAQILSPPMPGSAVCQGAVMLALNPDAVLSRVCKKTYGVECWKFFDKSLDPPEYRYQENGTWLCSNRFRAFVRKGEKVDVNSCITHTFKLLRTPEQKVERVVVLSLDERDPRYTTGETTRKEGEVVIDMSKVMTLDTKRQFRMSMQFGGSSIEVRTEAVNFSMGGATELELPVGVLLM